MKKSEILEIKGASKLKKKFIDEIYKMLQIKLLRKYLEDLQQIKSMKNKKNQIFWIKRENLSV